MSIHIAKRFNGPPNSGNGGYSCGVMAAQTNFLTEVTLRKPPPLDKDLAIQWEGDQVAAFDGELMIASARPGTLDMEVPAPPTFEQAQAAEQKYLDVFSERHVFPTCFVCGPKREKGDALHIFAGPVERMDLYASSWVPDASLAADDGLVADEFLWAAMDCPGYFSLVEGEPKPMVLGRMTAEVVKNPKPGEKCVVIAWPIAHDGKKHISGTAVYDESGDLCGKAQAIWIEIAM